MVGIMRQLRDLVPRRPLTTPEAMEVAELQAIRLLALSGIDGPPVPESVIANLPHIEVERMKPSPVSGAAQWSRGRWLVVLNGNESPGRQRYSLAHEFKHILDNPLIHLIYPAFAGLSATDRAEQICDYFAACLLMPRVWVKQHYFDWGLQDPGRLAQRFGTSWTAMQVRLLQIGLWESPNPCTKSEQIAA